jgi:hypothetical protein
MMSKEWEASEKTQKKEETVSTIGGAISKLTRRRL